LCLGVIIFLLGTFGLGNRKGCVKTTKINGPRKYQLFYHVEDVQYFAMTFFLIALKVALSFKKALKTTFKIKHYDYAL